MPTFRTAASTSVPPLLAGDAIVTGVNVENASYPLSVCAERNAIAKAVAAGTTDIRAVAVVSDADTPTPPCGGCRQVLRRVRERASP